jgi:hypothetical protein
MTDRAVEYYMMQQQVPYLPFLQISLLNLFMLQVFLVDVGCTGRPLKSRCSKTCMSDNVRRR